MNKYIKLLRNIIRCIIKQMRIWREWECFCDEHIENKDSTGYNSWAPVRRKKMELNKIKEEE